MNYSVGVYCRLSQEDGKDESQSISTQKELLSNYVLEKGWNLYDIYIDDGFSGTNFNRPDFNRLITDIKLNRINLVLTKDLSRLGRNYLYTGYLTEEFFPKYNVRYVALSDGYDSLGDKGGDFMPFRNVINEWYAKDVSKKIRFTLDGMAKKGEPRKTVFPIYGYKFNDKNERIIDSESSEVVKLIFKKFIEFGSTTRVANYLNELKIYTPIYYNAVKYGYNKAKILSENKAYNWTNKSVREIIIKEEYLGVYKTAKTKSVSFKNKKRYKNSESFIFYDRYEPIIDKNTFETANNALKKARSGSVFVDDNTYKGLIFCGNCNKPLRFERRNKNDNIELRYFCNNKNCKFSNSISKTILDSVLLNELSTLKQKIKLSDIKILLNKKGANIENNDNVINENQQKLSEVNKKIAFVVDNLAKGILQIDSCKKILENYEKEKEFYKLQIGRINLKSENANSCGELENKILNFDANKALKYSVLTRIISKIEITSTKENTKREVVLKIYYKYEKKNCNLR